MTNALKQRASEHPSSLQGQASDPLKSVWVGASAGTGKTKVLIDRVLRLMLPRPGLGAASATEPGKILCLTFTKTAAAEMSGRIYSVLSEWAVWSDEKLDAALQELTGEAPEQTIRAAARRLFARVLDAPGGLKIMTIHSFCQSVLKRFPVEAGLPPHFELMDEQSALEYLTRCLHDIIAEGRKNPASPLAQSFSTLALHLNAEDMSDLMGKIRSGRSLLSAILKAHEDAEGLAEKTIAAVYNALGLENGESEDSVLQPSGNIHTAHEQDLKRALTALLEGSIKDKEKAACIQPWLEDRARRPALFHAYKRAFFTKDGKIFKDLATQKTIKACPDIISILMKEAERLQEIDNRLKAARLAKLNGALLTVAAGMIGHYARHKRQTDKLDFDDLIIRTCDLLSQPGTVQWVLYKLDEGIDHILVDEAQDTSPYQWRVIRSLSEEFFSGLGAKGERIRTLFVVGDEKQSIFSFQGADPAEFDRMKGFFGQKVKILQNEWEIFLEYSFRSTRTVLEAVDGVFNSAENKKGLVFDVSRAVRHLPFREGHAGLVELWPLFTTQERDAQESWQPPVKIEAVDNAAAALAKKIAETIKVWLATKEILSSKARPVRPGDILILVQSRGPLVEMLLRALKDGGVPVAGIDRMTLTEEIAVMDLLALADFALQPQDDLTLATLLKSPLAGLSEEALYDLCYGRKSSLWAAVAEQRPDIHAWLKPWADKAGRVTPYEFFAEVLNTPCLADKLSGRRAFHARLGLEIQDALDEFLNACLGYEQSHAPSLQSFVDWFRRGQSEIKRDTDQGKLDQVRIMTVHAAKGLQAPIVFLPDATKKSHAHNRARPRLLWPEDETGVPLWSPRAEFDAPLYAALQGAALERQEEEYRRLLYVALTRAEDRLYICGSQGFKNISADCWYSLVAAAFPANAEKISITINGEELFLLRSAHPQEKPPEADKKAKEAEIPRTPLPKWVFLPPPEEPYPPQPLAPSRPGEDEPAAKGPLAKDSGWRFKRGVIAHQILQFLPQLPENLREESLKKYLARPVLDMPEKDRVAFAAEILAVLKHPAFAPIFGVNSQAEVPLAGITGRQVVSGQMDRILVTDNEVLIVDYKTNRPPPAKAESVPIIYLKQMASYKSIIRNVFPRHKISCALLWTDGPFLMPLSDNLLDPYLP